MARLLKLAVIALSTTSLIPLAAQAQVAAEAPQAGETVSDEPASGEIIVTARRRAERLLDAPVAISAVSGDTLAQYQATKISDISTLVPSLIVGRATSGSAASIFLRGVGSTALSAGFDQSVSFVIDGLAMSRGREVSLPQFDIQRVEVLKGPQALFFGKNTTGGLISVTSNNPTEEFEAGVKAGYGFEARERYTEAFISGPVTDTLRLRLAGRYAKSDGAFKNSAAPTYTNYLPGQVRTRTSTRRGFSESYGVRGTAEWDVTPNFTLQLKAGASGLDDGSSSDLLERICGAGRTVPATANGRAPSPNADCAVNGRSDMSSLPPEVAAANYRYARDGRMYTNFNSQFGVVTGRLTSDPFDVTSITGYTHFRQADLNNVAGEAYPSSFTQYTDYKQFSQELRFQSKFAGPFNILFGGFYSHGKFDFNTDTYIFILPIDPVTNTFTSSKRDNGFNTDSMSMFAEGTFSISPQLELSGGARYSHEARDSFQRSLPANSLSPLNFPNLALSDRYRDSDISPQVTLRYKPTTDMTFYAAYKQGFKAGGFNVSAGLNPAATVGKARFGAETAEGAEIGFRSLLLDRRLSVNLTAYRYTYSDLQVQFFDPVTISQVAGNAGKLRTQGFEGDFNYRLPFAEGLSFHGAVAYNDAKFHDFVGQCYPGQTVAQGCNQIFAAGRFNGQDYEDRRPPKAPKFSGRIGAIFETPLTDSGIGLRLSGDVSHSSSYNYTDALRPDGVQKAYTKVDASIALSGPDKRWTLSLIGRNLANKLVVLTANDIPFTGGTGTGTAVGVVSDMSAIVDNPRELFLELSLKF